MTGSKPCERNCTCKRHAYKRERHRSWVGEEASMITVHKRLRNWMGPANLYHCVDCGKKAHDWSMDNDTDGTHTNDYLPRCKSCHNIYDGKTKLKEIDVIKIKTLLKRKILTQKEIAECFNVSQPTINAIKTGKSWGWVKCN